LNKYLIVISLQVSEVLSNQSKKAPKNPHSRNDNAIINPIKPKTME
jgi:hypothetical protein